MHVYKIIPFFIENKEEIICYYYSKNSLTLGNLIASDGCFIGPHIMNKVLGLSLNKFCLFQEI